MQGAGELLLNFGHWLLTLHYALWHYKATMHWISLLYITYWDRVMHICISKLTIIGWDNGLSPDWRQAIIWTNAGILLIGPLGTNFSEILIEIHGFSFKKMINDPTKINMYFIRVVDKISSTQVSDSHLSPPGALQLRRASLQWT